MAIRETSASSAELSGPPGAQARAMHGGLVVAVQGDGRNAIEAGRSIEERIRREFPGLTPTVFLTTVREGEAALVPLSDRRERRAAGSPPAPVAPREPRRHPGPRQPARPAPPGGRGPERRGRRHRRRRAARRVDRLARPAALPGASTRGFDFVCPAYLRHRTDGAINTGIVAPLVRTLYGQALRQPLGTEAALSPTLARRLLADEDWRRRPAEAGSDAWLDRQGARQRRARGAGVARGLATPGAASPRT